MHRTNTNNATIQRNESEAIKSEKGDIADEVDSRKISTIRSPSADRSGGLQGQTLPVVEELGEASSTGGRSGTSRDGDEMPVTPAKDTMQDGRPLTPAKDYSPNNGEGRSKKALSRSSLDKELPPLPGGSNSGQAGPRLRAD